MYESGISPRKNQKLFIKLEIDCNPPADYHTELSFNQKYMPMNIFHYDMASLFAGKLHAVLFREYTKGRDVYDLMWFIGKNAVPNYPQLENAILQTTGSRPSLNSTSLRKMLLERISSIDLKKVHEELTRFLPNRDELKYITSDNLEQMIQKIT